MPLPSVQELTNTRNLKTLQVKEIADKARTAEGGGRLMSAEEIVVFDRLTEEIKALDTQLEQATAHYKREKELADLLTRLEQPAGRKTQPDQPGAEAARKDTVPATPYRGSSLRAFKGRDAEQRAYRCGMWARAVFFNDARAANECNLYGGGFVVRNSLSTAGNANILIPEEFSQAIIDLREQYGVFRRECRVQPMGRDTMVVPRRRGGVSVAFIGENATITPSSDPTWNGVRLTAKKLGGIALLSSEVDEDAVIDLADNLASEFAYALALKEDQCGFLGDGTSTYGGIRGLGNILVAGQSLVGAVDAATGHDTFAEIDTSDLAKVMAVLPAYVMSPKWYCSKVGAELVFGRIQAAAGGNTVVTLAEGVPQRTYMGYPIVISQVLPTSQGDLSDVPMLYFGDLAMAATLGNRRGITVALSGDRYFDSDQIGVKVTERVDIVVHDVGDTANAGPVVALVGE
jgi:HK97 family phage major capsid protein